MTIGDVIIPNLIKQAEEVFALYPEYCINMEKAMKESPFLVLKYRAILSSVANALVHENETRFKKAQDAYINLYNKLISAGFCYRDQGKGNTE